MRSHSERVTGLIGLLLAGLIGAGCNPSSDPSDKPPSTAADWTVQLDQTTNTLGRIWFFIHVDTIANPAQAGCAGSQVTTMLGTFAGPTGRVHTSNPNGTLTASWTRGTGVCDAISMTLSATGQPDFVLTGHKMTQAVFPASEGFGFMPEADPNTTGDWTNGSNGGTFYIYPTTLTYTPDSHFDVRMDVTETGCFPNTIFLCDLPTRPAAWICMGDSPGASCLIPFNRYVPWVDDTTINLVWPRSTTEKDDKVTLYLHDDRDGGGPDDQTTCLRPARGADLVQVEVQSGINVPVVRCGSGWTTFGAFRVVAGDRQSGLPEQALPVPLQVQLLDGANNGVPNTQISWTAASDQGSFSPSSSTTDASGKASTIWTLGPNLGDYTATASASLAGGASPTLTFTAIATTGNPCLLAGTVAPDEITQNTAWTKSGGPYHVQAQLLVSQGATLTVAAGTQICADGPIAVAQDGSDAKILVRGTLAEPVVFQPETDQSLWQGIFIYSATSGTAPTSVLTGVVVKTGSLLNQGSVEIQDARFDRPPTPVRPSFNGGTYALDNITIADGEGGVSLELGGPGTVQRVRILGGTVGIGIATANLTLTDCEVTGTSGDAIVIEEVPAAEGSTAIHHCNLFNNGGVGLRGATGGPLVDATGNWWGDPAGPSGPAGNGFLGNVSYVPFLTTPATLTFLRTTLTAPARRLTGTHK
jgi:hypothetical protein